MRHKVLLADSDSTSLELMAAVLTRDGFEVLATPDGGDALARFFEASPFLVICSENLSGVSGSELCRQVKAQSPDTRVVVLHGGAEIDGLGLAGELGCDAVLPLPFSYADLKRHLADWGVSVESAQAQVSYRVPTSEALEPPPPAAVPENLGSVEMDAPAQEEIDVPPLPVPIPVPVLQTAVMPEESLPELDLDDVMASEMEAPETTPLRKPFFAQPEPAHPEPDRSADSAVLNVPTEGSLDNQPLPRLIFELYLATFSGALHLTTSAANRSIFFYGGIPVRVDSSQLSEALGRILLNHGRITMEEYSRSLEIMHEKSCRQGEALIEMGVLKQAELLDALHEQTELKLVNTFAWRDATYRLEEQRDFARDTILSEVHPLLAIWRGVHEHYELDALLTYFIELEKNFAVATDLFAVYFEKLGPFLRDLDIGQHLDGQTTFGQVLQKDPRTLLVAQALYVLLVTDMIAPSPTPGAAAQLSAPPSPETTASQPTVDAATLATLSEEIAAEYLRVKDCDYIDVLRVDLSSTAEEVDAAYGNIIRTLKLDDLPAGLAADVLKRAREVRDILSKARNVVRDPNLRDSYLHGQQERLSLEVQPLVAAHDDDDVPMPTMQTLELDTGRAVSIEAEKAFLEGQGLMKSGQYGEAARKFQEAIAQCGTEPDFRVELGRAILLAEQTDAARTRVVTCLQQALQLNPAHVGANLEMAKLLMRGGKSDRALAYVQRVLQKEPQNVEARQLMASLG